MLTSLVFEFFKSMIIYMYYISLLTFLCYFLWKQYLCVMVIDRNVYNDCIFYVCLSFSHSDLFLFFETEVSLRPDKS